MDYGSTVQVRNGVGWGLVESLDKKYMIDNPTMDKLMSRLPEAIQQLKPTPLKGEREDCLVALNACLGSDALSFCRSLDLS